MMRERLILPLFFFFCFSFQAHAHDAAEAFFNLKEGNGIIEVKAELPWTIRKAFFKAYSHLEENKSDSAIKKSLFQYIESNIRLFDQQGNAFQLSSMEELPNQGHSHAIDYLLIYSGSQLYKIENSLLFNLNEHQVNYHRLSLWKQEYEFSTKPEQPSFTIDGNVNENRSAVYTFFIALAIASLLFIVLKKLFGPAKQ